MSDFMCQYERSCRGRSGKQLLAMQQVYMYLLTAPPGAKVLIAHLDPKDNITIQKNAPAIEDMR